MSFTCYTPTELVFGEGTFAEAGRRAARLGRRALLVVSRSAMERLGHTRRLVHDLTEHGMGIVLFNEVRPGVPLEDVDRGAELARRERVDCVVALGGGTVLDASKAIAAVAAGGRPAVDYLYQRAAVGPDALPVLAIPTTAGTGSEVNRSSVVTDVGRRFKDALRSDHLFPRCAIVDPLLTHDVPPAVTAQTGFDVLAHAVESYVSPRAQPVADGLALAAAETVCRCLPVVLKEPRNADARAQLALAGTTMGWNLSWVGTCFPHRIDKALCALHPEISHGQGVALFYAHWAGFSWRGAAERFARIAEIVDPDLAGLDVERRAAACAGALAGFIRRIGLGAGMRELGVRADELPTMAENAAGDLSVNPVPVRKHDVPGVLAAVYSGDAPA